MLESAINTVYGFAECIYHTCQGWKLRQGSGNDSLWQRTYAQ